MFKEIGMEIVPVLINLSNSSIKKKQRVITIKRYGVLIYLMKFKVIAFKSHPKLPESRLYTRRS